MTRFVVVTRRNLTSARSARDVLSEEPDVEVIDASDPHVVSVEATPERAAELRRKLGATHIVEPETRRGLQ